MEPNPANELLLTTLAGRDSRFRTARVKLGRLAALLAGLATVLLLAGHHPAKAAGMSSVLSEGVGLPVFLPLGDVAASESRRKFGVFAIVGSGEAIGFGFDRSAPRAPVRR